MQYYFKVSFGYLIRMTLLSFILTAFIPLMHAQPTGRHAATGAVVAIKGDSTAAYTATSLEKLIQGNAAGVKVTSADGAPGAAVDVLIRGINFITGGNQPLYVIDGVVMNPAQQDNRKVFWTDPTDFQMLRNPLSAINPMDIASIEVLKDAASTAVYGSMGANGVVLVKTKQGSAPGVKVSFTTGVSISSHTKKIDVADKHGYLAYYMREAKIPYYNPYTIKYVQNPQYYWDPEQVLEVRTFWQVGDPIDWQEKAFRNSFGTNNYLTVEGALDNGVAYMASAGYRKQNGIVKGSDAEDIFFRVNLDAPISTFGKVGMRTLVTNNQVNMLSGTNTVGNSSIIKQLSLAPPFKFNNNFGLPTDWNDEAFDLYGHTENPMTMIDTYQDHTKELRFIPNIYAEASIVDWLKFRTNLGIDYRNSKRHRIIGNGMEKGYHGLGMIGWSNMDGYRYNWDNTLTANLDTKFGNIFVQAGFSTNGNKFNEKIVDGHLFMNQPYDYNMLSGWGQLGWSFGERYFINATMRADNYKTFSDSWDMYPAVSVAWNVKNESFLESVDLLSALKIRGGWGVSGIKFSDPYRYFPFENFGQESALDPAQPIDEMNSYFHADVTEINAGLDLGFYNNRLMLSADYFNRKTKENLDVVHQGATPWSLLTEMDNSGVELSVNAGIVDNGDWKWYLGGNIFFNKPIVRKVNNDEGVRWGNSIGVIKGADYAATMFAEGQAPGLFYGLRYKGVLNTLNSLTAPAYYGEKVEEGNLRFLDRNGDGNIDDDDRTDIGNPNPTFSFGFNTCIQYQKFSISASFYGNYGNQILNLNHVDLSNASGDDINNIYNGAAYKQGGDFAAINSLGLGDVSFYSIGNGSFLRCSDITLGYNTHFGSMFFKNVSVGLSVKNPFIITKYKGYNPEVNSFVTDITRYGIDSGAYPCARTFILKISASF